MVLYIIALLRLSLITKILLVSVVPLFASLDLWGDEACFCTSSSHFAYYHLCPVLIEAYHECETSLLVCRYRGLHSWQERR